jgi:CBS domain-containing protein
MKPRLTESIQEIMIRDVKTITKEKSVVDAAKMMVKHQVGSLVVLEGKKILGIITEKDITRAASKKMIENKVEEVMSMPVKTVHPQDLLIVATNIMKETNYKRLPVVKDDNLVGVITQSLVTKILHEYSTEQNFEYVSSNLLGSKKKHPSNVKTDKSTDK